VTYLCIGAGGYQEEHVPSAIYDFAKRLFKALKDEDVHEIDHCFSVEFQQLTDELFSNSPWPDVKQLIGRLGQQEEKGNPNPNPAP